MMVLLTLLAMAQAQVGPLDGFRANYAAIRADTDFEYREGTAAGREVADGRLWTGVDVGFQEAPGRSLVGNWGCDGHAEYLSCGSPDSVVDADMKVKRKTTDFIKHIPKYETIYDGLTAAYHYDRDGTIEAALSESAPLSGPGNGPFVWWGPHHFPKMIEAYGGSAASPSRRIATRGGRPVEVEIYETRDPGAWLRLEVSYDPSVGYLPRYARRVALPAGSPIAMVNEFYLLSAQPGVGGGFFSTEWYETVQSIGKFEDRYPNYDDETVINPVDRVGVGHYKVTRTHPDPRPIRLRNLKKVKWISSIGGLVTLRPQPATLGLDEIRSSLGTKLTTPRQTVLPHLDDSELREMEPEGGKGGWWLIAIAVSSLLMVAYLIRRRRAGLLVLLAFGVGSGCGRVSNPVVHLTAAFTKTRVLYVPRAGGLDMTLIVKNDGNQAVKVLAASGGCTCREVDQSRLPADLRPGASISLPVSLHDRRSQEPQEVTFSFETDRGVLNAPVALYALAAHVLNPEAPVNNGLFEQDDWRFEMVHRQVHDKAAGPDDVVLEVPAEFKARKVGIAEGRVGGAPDYSYRDTTYEVSLVDRALGIRKAAFVLRDPARSTLVEAPVLWRRAPYLSSVPERVVLGDRPVRAFLRCPDDTVEIDRVLSAPAGIKAALVSPMMVSISLEAGAPPVIDGHVELATTAAGRPPLRIPVARYTPRLTSAR